jgi:DNA-binding LytR/AlgR family response regulator
MTIERLKAKVSSMPADLDGLLAKLADLLSRKEHLRWITASQGNDLRLITVDEICYLKAADKYTIVVTRDQESLVRRPIRELIEALDPNLFWQIHRGTIVNINAIGGITREFSGKLRVKLKQRAETLAVSDSYSHRFKSM